jgi:hypothetical protein
MRLLQKKTDPGDKWRINFSRVEYHTVVENGIYTKMKDPVSGQLLPEDNWTWAPQGIINIHYPEMWGYVQFTATEAGKSKEYCDEDPEAELKWALRRIYYKQRNFMASKGRFALNWEELAMSRDKDLKIKGWSYPPAIKSTESLFEAVYSNKSGVKWHIRQDGLIWKTEPMK